MVLGSPGSGRPQVVVIGGGAAGALVALHLARTAHQRGTGVDVVVVDPADRPGRGSAFGTTDDAHLLNVPAAPPPMTTTWGRPDPGEPSTTTYLLRRLTHSTFQPAGWANGHGEVP